VKNVITASGLLKLPRIGLARCAGVVAIGTLVMGGLALRVIALGNLPGINGDEARYGAQVMALKAGHWPDLRSGTGLPPNPLYTGPLCLIHLVAPGPSFALLRSVALASGLLVVGLCYPLLARVIGRWAALLATALLACSPVLIAYSRFGWDQSQAPLVGLLAVSLVLRRRWLLAGLAFFAALLVHPTNVFLAPVLIGPPAVEALEAFGRLTPPSRRRWLALGGMGIVAVAAAAGVTLALMIPSATMRATFPRGPDEVLRRAADLAGWRQFIVAISDLLAGPTIYQYIVGLPGAIPWHRGVAALVAVVAAAGLPGWAKADRCQALGLVGGLLMSLAAFYPIAGLHAISPAWERYAMWMVVPMIVISARSIRGLGEQRRAQLALVAAVCVFLLANAWRWYFLPQWRTGGHSELTFRTGPVEPKRAAFDAIAAAAPGQPVTILAEDWWCYNPLLYLSAGRPETDVHLCRANPVVAPGRRCFVVGFSAGRLDSWFQRHRRELPAHVVHDYGRRPVLSVRDITAEPHLIPALVDALK
jgi:hypothetical protein